jgi:hypothetical protein
MASVLIATDDFVHLKSRFAAVDGRGSQQGRKSQAAAGDCMCLAPTDLSLTPCFNWVLATHERAPTASANFLSMNE